MESIQSNFCVAGVHFDHNEIRTHVLPDDSIHTVALNPNGLDEFFQKLTEIDPAVAVMEAAEGRQLTIAAALAQTGVPVFAIHSRQLNQYAGLLKLEKVTTCLDAYVMARFALELHNGRIHNVEGYSARDLVEYSHRFAGHPRPPRDPFCEKIISDKFRFIWVGIPKAATRSILTALYREPAVDVAGREVSDELVSLLNQKQNYHTYYKFAFVRNPWARIVSSYLNKIQRFREETQRHIIDRYSALRFKMPFEEFIRFLLEDPSGRDEGANRHWLSQHAFVTDKDGKLLVDFIGKIENLEQDFTIACQRIGLPEIRLPWLNSREGWKMDKQVMKQKDPFYYRRYYTPQTRDLVRQRYDKDIELFEYEF